MANSTTNLDTISSTQAAKEITANAVFDAASPATLLGRRASTTAALTWGFYGGNTFIDGVFTILANGTVALTASATNFVEATRAGVVSNNIVAFTPGSIALYRVVTGASTVTSYEDYRPWINIAPGRLVLAMADANKTLTHPQALVDSLELTGALTVLRDVIVPLAPRSWTIFANTTGAFGVRIIGASGTGVTVADGKRAILESNGTNVVRVTADA